MTQAEPRGRGRPKRPPGELPKREPILGVTLPDYAFTRLIQDEATILKQPVVFTNPFYCPRSWYKNKGIALKWVLSIMALDETQLTALDADCRTGISFLVDVLHQDYMARKALAVLEDPAYDPAQHEELPSEPPAQPLAKQEKNATTYALLTTLRKLWIIAGIRLANQTEVA